ncbi:MAG: hypothetical protein GKR89_27915 [Candidatus Latescibacteria bacterium]|nr:hypothetical protein [Candidatus Latescibacterota bacterium]
MTGKRLLFLSVSMLIVGVVWGSGVYAQDYGNRLGSVDRGGQVSFEPRGSGVLMGALDPAKRRWYVPQELYNEYRWRQWEYSNYARQYYQRYVSTTLEGDYFYDLYGNFLTQGWLIFNNSQTQPKQFGSSVLKSSNFGGFFGGLVVSSDAKGQHHYAITISNQIRSTLTPMTFSKPRWDGIQFDYAMDKYEATVIYSRLSSPGGVTTNNLESLVTNATTLLGGRVTAQIGDFAKFGLTGVNAHQANTLIDGFKGNPVTGELTVDQNNTVSAIEVVLRDDSPEDGEGGAAFFPAGSDIIITYIDGSVDEGKQIRFEPTIEGGFVRRGFLSADGTEEIRLRYDFDSPSFINRSSGSKEEITKVEFRLVLGNDYQVWVTSDRQLNASDVSVLLMVSQAEGNVKDNTNLRIVSFEYGLPTSTQIWGGTLELREVLGFNFYGEYDLSYSYTKYPNVLEDSHSTFSGIKGDKAAEAWMMNLSRTEYPWFVFGEAYSMDPRYSTTSFVTLSSGFIDYEDERVHVVELVEDNDDQDQFPDTVRKDWLAGDQEVYPGWDENNDFISDYNQNDNQFISNSIPDYEEPFLHHHVDRPEFLFGIDLDNNGWIDRFQNDEQPDYPYRRNHQGYNLYAGAHIVPEVAFTVGALREDLISSNQRNQINYLLFTADKRTPNWGRFRLFEMLKSAEDDISDDLLQWLPNANIRTGEATKIEDPLIARDTWINSLWLGHDFNRGGLRTANYLKYDLYHQRLDRQERVPLGLRKRDFFFGLINKLSYRMDLGSDIWLEPRWKSQYRQQSIDLVSTDRREELTQLGGILAGFSLLSHTTLQTGLEVTFFNDLKNNSRDFTGIVGSAQFTNMSAYQGYNVITQMGVLIDRRDPKGQKAETVTRSFITVFAGLD